MSIRFAVLTAVSSLAQTGSDKISLAEQEQKCRELSLARHWRETAGPYVIPGQRRTGYIELSEAEKEIPALQSAMADARNGLYDLLVLYDMNRLRDLLHPFSRFLESCGIQLYSISQPVDPLPPSEFSRYRSDASSIMRGISGILSDAQIADLQRKYRYGNTGRVNRGLHSMNFPWGYRNTGKKTPAEQIPEQIEIIKRIKDMFWDEQQYIDIAATLDAEGIPSPRGKKWRGSYIKEIVTEPYYAGKVYFGQRKSHRDPHLNKSVVRLNPDVQYLDGKHEAIWTWDEHLAIVAEVARRAKIPNGIYTFSGLLYCSVCGDLMSAAGSFNGYACKKYCTGLKWDEANALVGAAIRRAMADFPPVHPNATFTNPESDFDELLAKRKRVQDAYESGSPLYTQEEAEKRIREIDAKIKQLQTENSVQRRETMRNETFMKTVEEWRHQLPFLHQAIKDTDPKLMNRVFRKIVKRIDVTPDAQIRVELWIHSHS